MMLIKMNLTPRSIIKLLKATAEMMTKQITFTTPITIQIKLTPINFANDENVDGKVKNEDDVDNDNVNCEAEDEDAGNNND